MGFLVDEALRGSGTAGAVGFLLILGAVLVLLLFVAERSVLRIVRRFRRKPAPAVATRRRPVEVYRPPAFGETALLTPVRVSDETAVLYRVLPVEPDATAVLPRIPSEVRRG
jgi:hypothetical protein